MGIQYDIPTFYDDLVRNHLIIPVGVQGAFGRGPIFEKVLGAFNDLVTRVAANDGAETWLFPPIITRKLLEKSKFLESFPQLAGTIFSFFGSDAQHKELVGRVQGDQPWGDLQAMTDVVLTPAACYPVYPNLSGVLPAEGRLIDIQNWVFRHEPSPEPTRMQAFRMREFVRAGTPETVIDWRNSWLERGLKLLNELGLPAKADVAHDPFFGRGGRMLAANQREQRLKFEVLIPVISLEKPTAVCSFNYHQDHFGKTFAIKTPDGAVGQTACLGFGLERCVMALFRHHGYDPGKWPKAVVDLLWG